MSNLNPNVLPWRVMMTLKGHKIKPKELTAIFLSTLQTILIKLKRIRTFMFHHGDIGDLILLQMSKVTWYIPSKFVDWVKNLLHEKRLMMSFQNVEKLVKSCIVQQLV